MVNLKITWTAGSDIPQYKRFCKSYQVNAESQDEKRKEKKLCSFNNENLDLHISYVPIYISRGSDYFF